MKKLLFLFTIFLLLNAYSCKESRYPHALLVADSLAIATPDSAVSFLKSIKGLMNSQPQKVQMYYQLLCIKAADKAYKPFTTDSAILQVLHYYIDKDDAQHLPEAYYYAGRAYVDLGDAPRALGYFNNALDALGDASHHQLRSLICSQTGSLYFYQCMNVEALAMFREAYKYSVLQRDSGGMVFDLKDIAAVHNDNDAIDSALYYCRKAYTLASAMKNEEMMNMMQGQLAGFYKKTGDYELAKPALQKALSTMKAEDQSPVYSIASELHHKMGNKDSACYYYKELLTCGGIYAKADAYWHLAQYDLEDGNAQRAIEHLKQYVVCIDSVWALTDAETVRKMHSLYNYTLREEENDRLKAENSRRQLSLIALLLAVVFLLLCFCLYFQYSRKRRVLLKLQLLQLKQVVDKQSLNTPYFLEKNKKEQEALQQKLLTAEQSDVALIAQIQKERETLYYAGKRAELEVEARRQAHQALLNSPIYQYFACLCSAADMVKVPAEKWNLLENAVNDAFKGFTSTLLQIHRLSRYELHVCLLIKIGVSPKEMAKLTNHSKESITSCRRRLYEKFFGEKGAPRQWDEFIESL